MQILENLFSPQVVAIIGASKTPGKVGHDILGLYVPVDNTKIIPGIL